MRRFDRGVFSGDGTGRDDLVRRCEGLSNVRLLPLQPLRRLSNLLALADVHLLPQGADAAELVMPSKLTGMLAIARPVVATAAPQTELATVVGQRAACGLLVAPENAPAIALALLTLFATDPGERAVMGARGLAYAKMELERDAVLGKFEQQLESFTQRSAAAGRVENA